MQTFLPYASFYETLTCLDYRRLGKQRVEARQILRALYCGGGWSRHPAVLMWKGYELALSEYYNLCIDEWVRRGYKNNMIKIDLTGLDVVYPSWLGKDTFHRSHRANLVRKDSKYYSFFTEDPEEGYYWPGEKRC